MGVEEILIELLTTAQEQQRWQRAAVLPVVRQTWPSVFKASVRFAVKAMKSSRSSSWAAMMSSMAASTLSSRPRSMSLAASH